MGRYGIALVLALAVVAAAGVSVRGGGKPKEKAKPLKFEGMLSPDSPKDPKRNTPCKTHVVPLKKGQSYVIHMDGFGFDAYLRLEDNAGKELAEDDDSGGGLNAEIIFNCPKDGDYKIYCTSVGQGNGKYVLTIKTGGAFAMASSHEVLLGKPAPDFEGDFALNGKPVKLSDLKGKVVVLDFWAVQSGDSITALSRLREWHRAHKDAGLEVVGVTYYNSELGHKLAFDSTSGKLKKLDAASPETDEAMLKAFADFHKLEHRLLALHKEKALKMFDRYLVNGLPQVVLIDRQGIVRHAYVGGAQVRNPDVEGQIKKLLAEK
jgi:peroxiredoxin